MMPTPAHRSPWFSLALALLAATALSGCVHDSLTTGSVASGDPVPYAGNPNDADRKASAECWMKYERGRADLPLDVRANLVDKCIATIEAKAGH